MIYNDTKTSLLVNQQLPEFVRDNPDYANFTLFLKAYYEWLELTNAANSQIQTASSAGQGLTYSTKNLLAYKDIDNTIDDFITYFNDEFMPYFPEDTLVDKRQALKIARQLYQTKGTPASYQFLFRVLYNSDFEVFYTKDAVLKPSDGVWYVPKSLKLSSTDPNFLNVNQYRLFGETTQSIGTIEAVVETSSGKMEVFISNIERLFQSGEYVRVIDEKNQDVLFNNQPLRAKVVGQISSINIDPNNRGLTYKVGDPVIVYGGLNTTDGHGAIAEVSETTKGSVKDIKVVSGGYGYTADPQSLVTVTGDGVGVDTVIATLDGTLSRTANVTFLPTDQLGLAWDTHLNASAYSFLTAHPTATITSKLKDALDFTSYTTYPIGSVIVVNGGGGFTYVPTAAAKSLYSTNYETKPTQDLSQIGILAPIQIVNGGTGYQANDKIIITGGSGYGAHANVITVASNGMIKTVSYVYDSDESFPLGGMGYKATDNNIIATVNPASDLAANAQLFVPGILGAGASFIVDVDRAGSITTIKLDDPGEDYVNTPNVSIKVQDIVVSNVTIENLPHKGDIVFQGANINVAQYQATVNSVSILQPYNDPSKTIYNLRVFEYNSNPNPSLPLTINNSVGQINMVMANNAFNSKYNKYGYKNFGDGAARASAKFLNGLVIGQGQYLNQQGQPSSFSVLQNEKYNNYTYEITVAKEIEKYRSVLLNLLHPSGTNVLGRMVDRTEFQFNTGMERAFNVRRPFYSTNGGIGQTGANAVMYSTFTNASNNVVQFYGIPPSVNLANVIFAGHTTLELLDGFANVSSLVTSVDYTHNKVTLEGNTWLTFANVATVTALAGSNAITITSLTGEYDIMNNGIYNDSNYPLKDIVSSGDKVLIANNSAMTVKSVNYTSGKGIIYLTGNLTNASNSLMAVSRTLTANSNLLMDQIFLRGPIGTSYIPELATESGISLTTEDGTIILLG